jgi:hypothetical protein
LLIPEVFPANIDKLDVCSGDAAAASKLPNMSDDAAAATADGDADAGLASMARTGEDILRAFMGGLSASLAPDLSLPRTTLFSASKRLASWSSVKACSLLSTSASCAIFCPCRLFLFKGASSSTQAPHRWPLRVVTHSHTYPASSGVFWKVSRKDSGV